MAHAVRTGERAAPSLRAVAWFPAAILAFALAACTSQRSTEQGHPAGLGRRVLEGKVRALHASPDGAWLAVLDRCGEAAAPFLPPGTGSCDLEVVPSAGGARVRVAGAVTTLPQGVAWADRLAALAQYDYPSGSGTLVEWRPGAAAREIAGGVSFYAFGAGGELAFVAAGELSVATADAPPRVVPGTTGAASFELAPLASPRGAGGSPVAVLVRRRAAAGGELLAVPASGRARAVAAPVADYGYARRGDRFAFTVVQRDGAELRVSTARLDARAAAVARGVRAFAFAPEGDALAYVSDALPGKQGDLHVRDGRGADRLLGKDVGEFGWATAAARLVWLEGYDPRVRSGTVGAGGPDLAPRTFGAHVSDVAISSDGRHVAFLQHTTRGGYSVDLRLAHLDAPGPPRADLVSAGVFGFAFSPDARWLYYRTRCTENADACDVERIPAGGLPAGAKPQVIAQGPRSFDLDPRDPERVVLAWKRGDGDALDLGVWDHGALVRVDTRVLAGSAQLLGPDGRRIAYAVVDPARAGVYVAALPERRAEAAPPPSVDGR
ncbi:hypothetical protein [Anaeromyxobacter oryzae]|uniref:Uncharacterized protein n=1 Tax=Anaeromyxobacter oryzae TaxID=2918170 RepID=A0ABN6MY88_9BACT|nr:hypothetical protein [Anaeromyxobacter oryzae]BDG05934.1 hypothetical protein AMOR_49300 [Anaeromyxobacter oryzae]